MPKKAQSSTATKAKSRKSPPAKKSQSSKKPASKVRASVWKRHRGFFLKSGFVLVLVILGWLLYLDATIRDTFEGQRWDIPARVYARPLEIFEGAALNPDLLEMELGALGYQKHRNAGQSGSYRRSGDYFTISMRGFEFSDGEEPARTIQLAIQGDVVSRLALTSGSPIASVRLDPLVIGGIYPAHHEDRVLVEYAEVPSLLPEALVAIEDKAFWEHGGISFKGIARALWVNVSSGELAQGGSTLTQQLVKNFYLDSRRTLWRKAKEAVMAVLLDWHYEKTDIMGAYLNEVYLGQHGKRSIHGFGLASQFYFSRPLKQLAPHQIAMLVAMVKGPTYYNPRRNPERALKRRNLVLKELAAEGILTEAEAKIYQQKPLDVVNKPSFSENLYPAFMDLVRRQLKEDYREEDLQSKGLKIFTTLDPQLQNRAEKAVKDQVRQRSSADIESALVVTGLETGEVKALVGGNDTRFAGFNRVLDANRPIGSLVKPAVYLAALSRHEEFTLASRVLDEEFVVEMPSGDTWQPKNFENKSFGDVSLHAALSHSMNLATAQLGFSVGFDSVIDTLHKLGVKKEINPYPSLFLGALTLSPIEVTQMYQTIAASGFNVPVRAIREITNAQNQPLQRYPYEIEQVIDSRDVHLLHYAMQEVMQEGTGKSAYHRLPRQLATAGKTGTTNDSRDSWFAGMTGDYLSVVWMGRDDNGPTHYTGATGAMKIWTEMTRSLPQRPFSPFVPEGIEYHWVSDDKFVRTEKGCGEARSLPFISGTEPTQYTPCRSGFQRIKGWFETMFE